MTLRYRRSLRYEGLVTDKSALERAFELAASGQYRSVSEVIRRLPREDREAVEQQLAEHAVRRELILRCSEAWLATQ